MAYPEAVLTSFPASVSRFNWILTALPLNPVDAMMCFGRLCALPDRIHHLFRRGCRRMRLATEEEVDAVSPPPALTCAPY
jgi:hypothetical protein